MTELRDRVLALARGGLDAIEAERSRIDDLNVYPVPDGDTGTNLALTVRAVVEALEGSESEERDVLTHQAARAALMGARGNSGVILSQIIRGAAESLRGSDDLAAALRSASDAAYRAVRTPVEGTMLTAIRALAEEAERGGDVTAVIARGEACVAATRDMLPVLAEAGVVDAGAAGLVEIGRGIAGVLAGAPLAHATYAPPPLRVVTPGHSEPSMYRYCTVFVVEGDDLDADALEAALEPQGDSLLVVGDQSALKVHLHTDDPGRAISSGVAVGVVGGVELGDLYAQSAARSERLHAVPAAEPPPLALVAIASGAGNRRLFESLGARVVDGGRTMNPSTSEILSRIEEACAGEVLLLPNDPNVLLAAREAAAQASCPVTVLATTTLQAGLVAAVVFDGGASSEVNVTAMNRAAAEVATGAVTVASREVRRDGIAVRKGEWLGLADGSPVAGGDSFDQVAREVAAALMTRPREILTLLRGEEPQPLDALLAALALDYPELELEVHEGGQPNYPLLLSAE